MDMPDDYQHIFIQLAPFQGLTDSVYRNSFAKVFGGIDEAFAPYISNTGADRVHPSKIRDVLPANNKLVRVMPQILSNSAGEIRNLANALADAGLEDLNWNLGCPFPQVTRKKRGAGLLPYPETIRKIMDATIPGLPVRLSIKIRAGLHRNDDLFPILEILDAYPLKEIIIHPRTADQLYKGQADPELFRKCCEFSRHSLVYNGDIINSLVFNVLCKKLPSISHWMIGRGALMDPTLPSRLRFNKIWTDSERRTALENFTEEIIFLESARRSDETSLLARMKSIWVYLSHSFQHQHQVFRSLRRTRYLHEFRSTLYSIIKAEPLIQELQGVIGENWKELH